MPEKNKPSFNILLGSKSPRRHELLKLFGLPFTIGELDIEETYPPRLLHSEIAAFLAEQKALPYANELNENDILITADTIVCLESNVLGKPKSPKQAKVFLENLSGKTHTVFTGYCLIHKGHNRIVNTVESQVTFQPLNEKLISEYIRDYKPFDKAGSYGLQDVLPGKIQFNLHTGKEEITYLPHKNLKFIENIEGSYSNVMGLPLEELYKDFFILNSLMRS